jgi:hypothetical protein
MTDCYRSRIQYRWTSFADFLTPEFDRSWIDEPTFVVVGMVCDFDSRSDTVHPCDLGIPPCQLSMGIGSDNTPHEEEYRYPYAHALLCIVHQSADNRFVVYGKKHGRLGGRYGYYCHYSTFGLFRNGNLVKGESIHCAVADGVGGFPFVPLVDRFPRHGRNRTW